MSKKWIDHEGNEIPAPYVPKLDKQKHRVACKMAKRARWINEKLAEFKYQLFKECDAIWNQMLQDNNVRTGNEGYNIQSFDKSIKIEVQQSKLIRFDDRAQLAKAKMFEWLEEQLTEKQKDVSSIIHHAWETRNGQLDTQRVMGLFNLGIKAKKWKEAEELLKESIQRDISKRYARIYTRTQGGSWKLIDLNFSSVDPIEGGEG